LLVETKITDYTPKTGSIYGGTLITIYGDNFSEDRYDNNVRIGLYTDCLVLSSTDGQITCRTLERSPDADFNEDQEELIVLLKLSEEAKCATVGSNCEFTWIEDSALPAITSYTADWDSSLNYYVLTI